MTPHNNLELGAWLHIEDPDNPLCSTPVTYLGTDMWDGYILYAEGHIEILSTKESMFRPVKDHS